MGGVPVVLDVVIVLSLDFLGSLTNNLFYLVGFFPNWTELAYLRLLGFLEDSAQYPVSHLEGPHFEVLVVVLSNLFW